MRLNWANFMFIPEDGYGRMGLGFVRALLRAGHDVYPFAIDEYKKTPAWYQKARGLDFDRVTIQLMPPHEMARLPGRSFGYTMHESLMPPKGWTDYINQTNQWLLVPSPWLVDMFQEHGVEIPIEVVPGGTDPDECPVVTRSNSGSRPYTFGALADRGGRKGDDEVYAAFYKAFDYNDRNVRLIIKCRPSSKPNMDFSYSRDDRLTVWRADVDHIGDIYAQMDAFICPSKCEGYGMTVRESAMCGVPAVVIRFSGTADDCDSWAVPLENFKIVESGMEGCGGKWAQPNMDELVWRMRDMYENQDKYRTKGLQAAQWMRANATYDHAAKKLTAVIDKYMGHAPPARQPEIPVGQPEMNFDAKELVTRLMNERVSGNGHKELA